MFPNYDSRYKRFANQSLDWLPSDTQELYQHNLKSRYDDLLNHGWIDNHFTYEFNSFGFRCHEFTSKPTIMFLGCSITQGIGLPNQFIFPQIVSKQLNMHCANLGIAGGSHDTAFRMCLGYIDKIQPQIVICMTTPSIRFELVTDNSSINIGSWNHDYTPLFKDWSIDENNHYFNTTKNTLAINALCLQRHIKFFCVSTELMLGPSLARDLLHPGIAAHTEASHSILSLICGSA